MTKTLNKATVMSRETNISEPIIGYPDEEGLYLYKCMEIDYEWFYASITKDANGLFFIHEEGLGKTWLNAFCDGLIDFTICKVGM